MPAQSGATAATTGPKTRRGRFKYDFCFSFAGEHRHYVAQVVRHLKKINPQIKVFYDNNEETDLWGKDLPVHFDGIYQHNSRYCVMFISEHYARKEWTNLERSYALARVLSNKGKEYILPAYFDDTILAGVPKSLAHADLRKITPLELAQRIAGKLGTRSSLKTSESTASSNLPTAKGRGKSTTPSLRAIKTGTTKPVGPLLTTDLSYRSQIKGSGHWMLLDGEFYPTREVKEASGRIQVRLADLNPDQLARLVDFDPQRGTNHRGQVSYAYGEDAAKVEVESVESISTSGKRLLSLTLRPSRNSSGSYLMWPDAVQQQAQELLLTLTPDADSHGPRSVNYGAYSSTQKPLTAAWQRVNDGVMSTGDCLRCMRLEAIFQLKTKGVAEHVLHLHLGPMKQGVLNVSFRGRASGRSGDQGQPFEFAGTCDLSSSS